MSLGGGGFEQQNVALILDKLIKSDPDEEENKLTVKEIYVLKDTGKLVIVYDDEE
jgi:hypothetical protein